MKQKESKKKRKDSLMKIKTRNIYLVLMKKALNRDICSIKKLMSISQVEFMKLFSKVRTVVTNFQVLSNSKNLTVD